MLRPILGFLFQKICWSPNPETYLHMRMKNNIGGGADNLQPKTIYGCLDR